MIEKRYLLIQGSEDGNPLTWLDPRRIEDIGALMEDHSVRRFLDDVPTEGERDPSYWSDGQALLLEVRVLRVRPKEVITSWTVE